MQLIKKKEKMTKLQVNKHIFYFELSSKPHVDTIVIKVSIWRRNYFETIFTYDDLVNIQYAIGKVFGYIERAYSMLEKKKCHKRTNIPHATPNY